MPALHHPDILPDPFDWLPVPAGQVTLETGALVVSPPFAIARYPVTNGQYATFATAPDGYTADSWWDFSADARTFHAGNATPPHSAAEGDLLPRTNVCWYEAVAFCRWLSARAGSAITLPTEAQWQFAAAGTTGWRYPWGDAFAPERCNFNTDGPSPVTAHPGGASPFGAFDMSGNVWEWCLDDYATGSVDISAGAADRVLRGGSWWCRHEGDLTVNYRSGGFPHGWSHDWGFRIARAL